MSGLNIFSKETSFCQVNKKKKVNIIPNNSAITNGLSFFMWKGHTDVPFGPRGPVAPWGPGGPRGPGKPGAPAIPGAPYRQSERVT